MKRALSFSFDKVCCFFRLAHREGNVSVQFFMRLFSGDGDRCVWSCIAGVIASVVHSNADVKSKLMFCCCCV